MDLLSVWMCINANYLKGTTPGTEAQFIILLLFLIFTLSLPSNTPRECIQARG